MRLVDNTMASMRWATVATGAACDSATAHAAAIGAAREVPPQTEVPPVYPVEVTNAPAANRSAVGLRLENQVGWCAAVLDSLQPRKQSPRPSTETPVPPPTHPFRSQRGHF